MSNLLQTDVRAYRICILYEALHNKPIEEAYKHMREVMPNIDFPDFEYWYYRFLSGNHDLNHDRNMDPKTRGFSDMPIDVVERMVGELDVLDRLSLRKVSRNLCSIVDIQKTKCESVSIEFSRNTSSLKFEDATINYRFAEEGLCTIRSERNYQYRQEVKTQKEKLEGFHWELAINDLSSFLINPNWRFEKIGINFNLKNNQKKEDDAKPLCLLKSMLSSTRIHVEEINIISTTLAPAATLLPYFKPDSLKSIKFWSDEIEKGLLEQIMRTDHWKTANELHFKNIPDWFDIKDLFHAREFSIWNCDLSDDRIRIVRDVLLKSKTLEWCSLGTESNRDDSIDVDYPNLDQDLEALDEKVFEIMNKDPAYTGSHYNVDGADFFFQIKCDRWCDTVCLDVRKTPISKN